MFDDVMAPVQQRCGYKMTPTLLQKVWSVIGIEEKNSGF